MPSIVQSRAIIKARVFKKSFLPAVLKRRGANSMNLYEQKWQKFLKRIWPFNFIPFVDFVFAAGSLATGKMREDSDFDAIVGSRQGRIFIARAFCILFFGLLGWRRRGSHSRHSHTFVPHSCTKVRDSHYASDKFCFSHFVTPRAYRLSPPYNRYWQNLYLSLVPVYGEKVLIQKFWDANRDWMEERKVYAEDKRHIYKERGLAKLILEWMLSGPLGDRLEKKLKIIQIKRIEQSLKTTEVYKPRIVYGDNELEFHPDTKRIQDFLQNQR